MLGITVVTTRLALWPAPQGIQGVKLRPTGCKHVTPLRHGQAHHVIVDATCAACHPRTCCAGPPCHIGPSAAGQGLLTVSTETVEKTIRPMRPRPWRGAPRLDQHQGLASPGSFRSLKLLVSHSMSGGAGAPGHSYPCDGRRGRRQSAKVPSDTVPPARNNGALQLQRPTLRSSGPRDFFQLDLVEIETLGAMGTDTDHARLLKIRPID